MKCSKKTLLISSSRSGSSLLSGILNCSAKIKLHPLPFENVLETIDSPVECQQIINQIECADIYVISINPTMLNNYHLQILDGLTAIKWTTELDIIWLVRNPVITSASCSHHFNMSPDEALNFWSITNTCIWYLYNSMPLKQRYLIHYEDILINQNLKGIFQFIGEDYCDQYLTYGDFDQPNIACPIFSKGEIDCERVDPYPKHFFNKIYKKYTDTRLVAELNYNSATLD